MIGPPPKLWSRGGAAVALTTRSRPPRSRSARARASATSAWSDASPRTADGLGMGLAQRVEGLLGAGHGQGAPARRQPVGHHGPADIARAERDEDGWAAHPGSLPAEPGGMRE